ERSAPTSFCPNSIPIVLPPWWPNAFALPSTPTKVGRGPGVSMIKPPAGPASRAPQRQHYEEFRAFLEKACGIVLGDNKQYLVSSRLSKLMLDHGIADLQELTARLQLISQRPLREAVIDAMTTNETLWFRDAYPYTIFRERLLPELQKTAKS